MTIVETVTENTTPTRAKAKKAFGTIAFVAAGPGAPELLTVRGAALIRSAELVIVDVECRELVAKMIAPDVELVVIGVSTGTPAKRAKVAVDAAKSGRHVVRVHAGDPVLDGAVTLEAAAAAKAGVGIEIAPGVSMLAGVAAYAGVGLIGGRAREVRVVDADDPGVDWTAHTEARVTLVVTGPANKSVTIAKALIAAGRAPSTPAAITLGATTFEQQTTTTTLEELAASKSRRTASAVLVIGEAVPSRSTLSWFETKPLFGWDVLVPRTKEQAAELSDELARFGAVAHEVPTISVEPPRTPHQMARAITGLVSGRYQWVAFTSVNAVRAVREKFEEYGLDARAFAGLKVAAVGEQTAAALTAFGVRPDLVPPGEQSSAGLLEEWPDYDSVFDPINRVFLPRADIATETLVAGLVELGWEVEDVTAYRTVRAAPPPAAVRDAIKTGGFDAVLFTSSSTVRNLVGIAGKPSASTVVACIGPATAKTAQEHGLRVDVIAPTPSVAALATALADFGETLRAEAADAGEQVWRPSRRRPSVRRKTT